MAIDLFDSEVSRVIRYGYLTHTIQVNQDHLSSEKIIKQKYVMDSIEIL